MRCNTFIATTGENLARATRTTNGEWSVETLLPGMQVNYFAAHAASGGWTEEEFAAVLRSGITPSGRTLNPEHMPWDVTSRLTDEEITALWLCMQTLAPTGGNNR